MVFLALFLIVPAVAIAAIRRSQLESRVRYVWLIGTGWFVAAIAASFIWVSLIEDLEAHHRVVVEILRGMAAELLVAFMAVAIIERLLERQKERFAESIRSQIEITAWAQLSDVVTQINRIADLPVVSGATLWSLDRVDRHVCDAESTVIRLDSFDPEYRKAIQAFLEDVSRWKDAVWECQRWILGRHTPEESQPAWEAVRLIATQLATSSRKLAEHIAPPPEEVLTTVKLAHLAPSRAPVRSRR